MWGLLTWIWLTLCAFSLGVLVCLLVQWMFRDDEQRELLALYAGIDAEQKRALLSYARLLGSPAVDSSTTPDGERICRACGKIVRAQARFCSRCGRELKENER